MTRARRRWRRNRPAGIWRGESSRLLQPVDHSRVPGLVYISWRLASFILFVFLGLILLVLLFADPFYVRNVDVSGTTYLTKEQVFTLANVANHHILSLSPEEVRENLLRSLSIADAHVIFSWPPDLIRIEIMEREPALVWEQEGEVYWVDNHGRRMSPREERSDLVRVVASANSIAGSLDADDRVASEIIFGALQLKALFPNLGRLHYDSVDGLGYTDAQGRDIWFGVGTDMPEKLQIYQSVLNMIQGKGIQPVEINVANPDAPYYTIARGS